MTKYIGFAGTYTKQTSEGVYQFELDTAQGLLKGKGLAAKVDNPTYLNITKDKNHLYAVAKKGDQGGVNAYKINPDHSLEFINTQLSAGPVPCYVDTAGKVLTTANYHNTTVGMAHLDENGRIDDMHFVEHDGHGPHERQEKPHLHYAGFSPCKKYVFACDLGSDDVITYQITDNGLKHVSTLKVKPGSGPRHLVFHPEGDYAFLITELSSEVAVLAYDKENATFTPEQYSKIIPEDFKEVNDASAIHVSQDGRFLYAGNRGHNSIAVFQIDGETKQLTFVERVPSGGDWPRDFVIDPTDTYLVVSNQHSGNAVLFERNKETGKLTQTDSIIDIPEVVCVKFL